MTAMLDCAFAGACRPDRRKCPAGIGVRMSVNKRLEYVARWRGDFSHHEVVALVRKAKTGRKRWSSRAHLRNIAHRDPERS
jgi:hypothetical protein